MDYQTVLSAVEQWPVEDRMRLIQDVGELLPDEDEMELTEELKAKLDRRIAAIDANPRDVISWEAIKAYVRRPR